MKNYLCQISVDITCHIAADPKMNMKNYLCRFSIDVTRHIAADLCHCHFHRITSYHIAGESFLLLLQLNSSSQTKYFILHLSSFATKLSVRFFAFHAVIKISTTQNERNSHTPAKVPMHGNIAGKQLYILHYYSIATTYYDHFKLPYFTTHIHHTW
jgi:hypothetical protein